MRRDIICSEEAKPGGRGKSIVPQRTENCHGEFATHGAGGADGTNYEITTNLSKLRTKAP